MNTAELAKRATIAGLVATYRRAVADIESAFASIHAAETSLNDAFSLGNHRTIRIRDRQHGGVSFDNPSSTIEALKRDVWASIVDRLEIRSMLSVKRAKELDNQLERGELPPVTEASVYAFARGYADNLTEIHGEAVREVFDFLRPVRSRHKTNSEYEIGPKAILERMVSSDWSTHYRVNYYRAAQLTALENVFTALDGKGFAHKGYRSDVYNAVESTPLDGTGKGATAYFAFRCFKNGNLHVEFRRPDLVARLNQIAGGMRLR